MPNKRSVAGDLEFHVQVDRDADSTQIFTKFEDAAARAVIAAVSRGVPVFIDVVTWTRAAALKWCGEVSAEIYDEDPDASVHQRIIVHAQDQGKIA